MDLVNKEHSVGFFTDAHKKKKSSHPYTLLIQRRDVWKGVGTTQMSPHLGDAKVYRMILKQHIAHLPIGFRYLVLWCELFTSRTIAEKLLVLAFLKKANVYPISFDRVYQQDFDIKRSVFQVHRVLTTDYRKIDSPLELTGQNLLAMQKEEILSAHYFTAHIAEKNLYQRRNPFAVPYIGFKKIMQMNKS